MKGYNEIKYIHFKKIKVGFQERSDTFTKKLAYVIYYDQKGKLRKEKSWNSWKDDKIQDLDFDNIPTSGFVLNKMLADINLIGIIENHISEFMIQEDLSLRLH